MIKKSSIKVFTKPIECDKIAKVKNKIKEKAKQIYYKSITEKIAKLRAIYAKYIEISLQRSSFQSEANKNN